MLYFKRCGYSGEKPGISLQKAVKTEAHELLRSALIQYGIPENKHEFIFNEYGKPELKYQCGLHFNISHCSDMAVCAVAKSCIGVDAEKIRDFPERVMKRCFTEFESDLVKKSPSPKKTFFQLWTLKESFVKAIGKGLSYPLRKAEFIIENNNICAHTVENFTFAQIIIESEYVCSVCCADIFSNRIYHRSYEEKLSFEPLSCTTHFDSV